MFDAYFDNGVDIKNRRVFLDSEITASSIGAVVRGLYLMDTESNEPCEMFIDSDGGDLYKALALYDIMHTVKCPIHTFAYGACMSAAPLLLAAGEIGHRWVAPHVSLMHHDLSSTEDGTRTSIKAAVAHNEYLYKMWITLLAKHSNQTLKWWNSKSNQSGDFYYYADDAIEWAIADQIWVEK